MGQVSVKENGFQKMEGSGVTPKDLDSIKKTFLSEVVETVDMNDIPGE